MIISERMASAFIEWDDQRRNFKNQTMMLWGELSCPIATVQDKETLQPIKTAYFLFYNFRLRLYGDIKQDIIFTAVYQTQYMINFEVGNSVIEDFFDLFHDSKKRLTNAWENRIKNTPMRNIQLPGFGKPEINKVLNILFLETLPKYNLR